MKPSDTKILRNTGQGSLWKTSSFSLAAWLPALVGMLVICGESTPTMGADNTAVWLTHLCSPLMHVTTFDFGELNHLLRKNGHFFGYGMLGVIFARGWLSLLRVRVRSTWVRMRVLAASLGVISAGMIASMDEIHQSFLPNRGASVWDVLLDTSGALLLTTLMTAPVLLKRQRCFERVREVRSSRRWRAGLERFERALATSRS